MAKPMNTYDLFWSPEGRKIATVKATTAKAAKRKAPKPYVRYQGEIYAVQVGRVSNPRRLALSRKWMPAKVRVDSKGRVQLGFAAKEAAKIARNPGKPGAAFARCVTAVSAKGGAYDPRAVCAAAGRKKYGKAKFQRMAAAGKRRAARARKPNPSMYLDSYLRENESRGWGKGLTPATYLGYHLHGKAKTYSAGYSRALLNALHVSGAVKGPSAGGGTAYYPGN